MNYAASVLEQHESKPDISNPYRPASRAEPFRPGFGVGGAWMSGHGSTPMPQAVTPWSAEKIDHLQTRLRKKLGPEYVSSRGGAGSSKVSYIEGWKLIALANEVFGFNGWSSSIVRLDTNWVDTQNGKTSLSVTAIIRITLADGCFHEDVGNGSSENQPKRAAALEKAQKQAVTDGTKRAFRAFGNLMGNCLYDKDYLNGVQKIKVPPEKFIPDDLERRAEFRTPVAGPSAVPARMSNNPQTAAPPVLHRSETAPPSTRPGSPLRAVDDTDYEDGFADLDEYGMDGEFDEDGMQLESVADSIPKNPQPPAKAQYADPSKTETPQYQHRQRPDAPASVPPQKAQHQQQGSSKQPYTPSNLSRSAIPAQNPKDQVDPKQGQSSGGSSSTVAEDIKPRKVGGFAGNMDRNQQRNPSTTPSGAAARRQAILALEAAPPPRSESPKIPSGGIDDVALRARMGYGKAAAKLEVDENINMGGIGGAASGLNGFASARGVKRHSPEEGSRSVSPTKQSSAASRSGPRKVLGEIGDEMGDLAKRQRAG